MSALDKVMGALGPPALVVTHEARPWTVNSERRMHPQVRARFVREWREAFWALALGAGVNCLPTPVVIVVDVEARTNKSKADTAACAGAIKAGVDGLVDARVIPDDRGEYLAGLLFLPPRVTGRDAVTLGVYTG